MARIKLIQHLQEAEVQDQRKDLLHIADLSPEGPTQHSMLRSEAKVALQVARAMAVLIELILMREWDRVFVIVEERVFMQFPGDDLLAGEREDVAAILGYLEDFNRWRDAMLELVVHAVPLDGGSPCAANDDDVHGEARATLTEFRTRRAPDGESLDAIFRLWVDVCARVQGFSLMAADLGGRQVRSHMPAKVQIRASLPAALTGSGMVEQRRHDVAACADYLLIQSPTGELLLVRHKNGDEPIKEGSVLVFAEDDATELQRWLLIS